MESGTLTIVLHDFFTTTEGELSLNKGDYFLIYNIVDKHWCYGQSDTQIGKFPINHLLIVDIPIVDDSASLFISIASFHSQQVGDLPFEKGQIIVGRNEVQPGWYSGYLNSRKGIFPLTHVWQLDRSLIKKPVKKKAVRKKAKVKTTLKAQLDEELDLTEGEIITVTEVIEDGWCFGVTRDNRKGTFPEAFVTYIDGDDDGDGDNNETNHNFVVGDPLPLSIQNEGLLSKDFGETSNNRYSMNEPAPDYYDLYPEYLPQIQSILPETMPENNNHVEDPNPLGVQPYAITLYPFKAQYPNELSFESGEIVHLLKHIDSEWAEGFIDSVKGIFPVSYVSIIVDCEEKKEEGVAVKEKSISFPKQENVLEPDMSAKVEYTFVAQMDGDLSVEENDVVTVVEVANKDWIMVRDKDGKKGWCPSSYLSPAIEPAPEVFHDALEEFVIIRHHEEVNEDTRKTQEVKRLSQPHRPAPPIPAPGRVPLQKQCNISDNNAVQEKQRKANNRQNVISELVLTEKEYVRDLKVTYETFNLYNPSFLESRGIDVSTLFGNIEEVTKIAEELLDLILKSMKDCDEELQTVGPCFVEMANKMQSAYVKYCTNHEAALALLQKYSENKDIMVVFDKGVETLRRQVTCFDMDSILIKPVQRILKYPLLLHELIKSTEDDHPDKKKLEEAWIVMSNVAQYINESKRRKDIISKYWDSNNTLMRRIAKFNMHSVAKKSTRSMAMISASLGSTNLTPDTEYEELTKQLKSIENCTKQLGRDIQQCISHLNEDIVCNEVLAELLNQYHQGTPNNEIYQLCKTRAIIKTQYLQEFECSVERKVKKPLIDLITLLEGPEILIRKRHHKMLDYDFAISKNEKYKDNRNVQEELITAKNNFEALHQQLKEELPIFIDASTHILCHCIDAFANARMLFNGRVMKLYLQLSQSASQVSLKNILESFLVKHNLLYNQISRLKLSPPNTEVHIQSKLTPQSEKLRRILMNNYPCQKLYIVTENVEGSMPLDISVVAGSWIAMIKEKDPTGDTSRWFVDNGETKGFLPNRFLKPFFLQPNNENRVEATADQNSTPDLLSLDSPLKELENKMEINLSQSLRNMNVDQVSTDCSNYTNVNEPIKFYYALFDFSGKHEGTMSITTGQALKLITPHDQKGNNEWWLMQNRNGDKGYVPRNYVGPKELLLQ